MGSSAFAPIGQNAHDLHGRGVDVVGACCGSSPAHIAAIAKAIEEEGYKVAA